MQIKLGSKQNNILNIDNAGNMRRIDNEEKKMIQRTLMSTQYMLREYKNKKPLVARSGKGIKVEPHTIFLIKKRSLKRGHSHH